VAVRRPLADDEDMRSVIATLAAVGLLYVPLAAAELDPSRLALAQADVPPGYRFDERTSGVRSNAVESNGKVEVRRLLARTGRTTGYEAEFDKGELRIESRIDVFRQVGGSRKFFDWFVVEMRKAGVLGLTRSRVRIGAGGWTYTGRASSAFTLVVWRYDRVFGGVVATGLSKAQTLALARVQQRRMAAALR
jgi:hypothetical protein